MEIQSIHLNAANHLVRVYYISKDWHKHTGTYNYKIHYNAQIDPNGHNQVIEISVKSNRSR
jgi:hypothetical protein